MSLVFEIDPFASVMGISRGQNIAKSFELALRERNYNALIDYMRYDEKYVQPVSTLFMRDSQPSNIVMFEAMNVLGLTQAKTCSYILEDTSRPAASVLHLTDENALCWNKKLGIIAACGKPLTKKIEPAYQGQWARAARNDIASPNVKLCPDCAQYAHKFHETEIKGDRDTALSPWQWNYLQEEVQKKIVKHVASEDDLWPEAVTARCKLHWSIEFARWTSGHITYAGEAPIVHILGSDYDSFKQRHRVANLAGFVNPATWQDIIMCWHSALTDSERIAMSLKSSLEEVLTISLPVRRANALFAPVLIGGEPMVSAVTCVLESSTTSFDRVLGAGRGAGFACRYARASENEDYKEMLALCVGDESRLLDLADVFFEQWRPNQERMSNIMSATGISNSRSCTHILATRSGTTFLETLHLVEQPAWQWQERGEEGIATVCGQRLGYKLQPQDHFYNAERGRWSSRKEVSFGRESQVLICPDCKPHAHRFEETMQEPDQYCYDVLLASQHEEISEQARLSCRTLLDDEDIDPTIIGRIAWIESLSEYIGHQLSIRGRNPFAENLMDDDTYRHLLKCADGNEDVLVASITEDEWKELIHEWLTSVWSPRHEEYSQNRLIRLIATRSQFNMLKTVSMLDDSLASSNQD